MRYLYHPGCRPQWRAFAVQYGTAILPGLARQVNVCRAPGQFSPRIPRQSVVNRRYFHLGRKMSIRLFEDKDHADLYSKHRPSYPSAVYSVISEFCHQPATGSDLNLAVDIGCGTGISTRPLCDHFRNVIGTDISEEQIAKAKENVKNATFRVSPAEELSFLSDGSVDLITVAQAIHWLDWPRFYSEADRVLKPHGVLAAYGYGNNELDIEEGNKLQTEFYAETLRGYWDERRRHIDTLLADIPPPFKSWHRDDSLRIERAWTVEAYIGYLASWSAWQTYHKTFPQTTALDDLKQGLTKVYKARDMADSESLLHVTWPVFILMERKPV